MRGQRLKMPLNYRTQKTNGTLRAVFKTPSWEIGDFDGILRARFCALFGAAACASSGPCVRSLYILYIQVNIL